MTRAADDPRWADDPSPAWNDYGEHVAGLMIPEDDTPDNPAGDVETVTVKLWPAVHPAVQEPRDPFRVIG